MVDRNAASEMVSNLTKWEGFNDRDTVTVACNFEYVSSRVDPKLNKSHLYNGVLEVREKRF